MKYLSDNKSVERALNKTWWYVGIPFISIFIALVISGFYLMTAYKLKEIFAALTLFGSLIISGFIGYLLSARWFAEAIDKVDAPAELAERTIRNNMLFESTVKKILLKKNITLTARKGTSQHLNDLQIHNKIKLTNDYIDIDNEIIFWKELKDFRIITSAKQNFTADHTIYLILKNNVVKIHKMQLKNIQKIEYEIDRYRNSKNLQTPIS
jgi:hypothetical protein